MEKLLLVATLACSAGDRPIDLTEKVPRNLDVINFVVSIEPFYARLYIYELGFPDRVQQCCSNKSTSVVSLPVRSGKFCIRQSQPSMKWTIRALLKPDMAL